MNKKLIIVISVVLLLGVASFMFAQSRKPISDSAIVTQESSGNSLVESFTGTLKEAVALNVPMKCKYTVEGVDYESSIKGTKFRGTVMTPEGKTGNVLLLDTCMYSWEESQSQGLKVCYEPDEKDIWDSEDSDSLADNYSCSPANIPDSEFELPSEIEFLDMGAFLQDIQSGMPEDIE